MQTESEQYALMKKGLPYRIDEYLFKRQEECSKILREMDKLTFNDPERLKLLKSLLGGLGEGNVIKEGFCCNYGFNIKVGNNCYFNYGLTVLDSFEVEIGDNVFIAPRVTLSPVTHPITAANRRDLIGKKIVIEDDVWICAHSLILPGVTIHKGAVIAAGAVVKTDVPANTLYGGVPAKFIKNIDNG